MGYNTTELKVTAVLSAHNSEEDTVHERLWDEFRREVEKLAGDPRFAAIDPMLF